MKSFCILPFIHLSTRTDGSMQLCCHANSSGDSESPFPGCNRKDDGSIVNLKKDAPNDYWNTNYYKKVRTDLVNGLAPRACNSCYHEEELGYRSKRVWENEYWNNEIDFNRYTKSVNENLPVEILYLDMKLGNKCDLACIMCNPGDSTKWIPDYNKLMKTSLSETVKNDIHIEKSTSMNWWKNNTVFWEFIQTQIKNIKQIYIIGGEPTIIEQFRTFLAWCIEQDYAKNISLRFNTNGLTCDTALINMLTKFNYVSVNISIDDVGKRNEYIRYPSKWNDLVKALYIWDNTPSNIEVDLDCTINALNVLYLDELVRWKINSNFKKINKKHFAGTVGIHLLWNPAFLHVSCLPEQIKQKAIFNIEQLKIELGLDVTNKYKKFDAVINALKQSPKRDWKVAIEYLDNMDIIRNTSWQMTFKELS